MYSSLASSQLERCVAWFTLEHLPARMLAGRSIRLVRSLEANCQVQNSWRNWVCLAWRRKHFPAFHVTSTIETPV